MLSRNVLSKGQIAIPKDIRDMLDIHTGDEIEIDVDKDRMILTKKQSASEIFEKVSRTNNVGSSMEDIKKMLKERYEEEM
ncbi:MAG: AbrB/MazE/SpoVT family DNA-binding domain-containing protein [Candidatus Thermoplasmatota archaeon]|nr:AbrB/MazE/SpoVT family DNA-binding domain-containing protein [Candidatus Thermoplasmatota archaeon]